MCISRATVSAVSCLVVPAFICIDLLISLVLKINDDDDDELFYKFHTPTFYQYTYTWQVTTPPNLINITVIILNVKKICRNLSHTKVQRPYDLPTLTLTV